jgi:hypothetical protein
MIDPPESSGRPVKVKLDPAAEYLLNHIRASGFPGWSSVPVLFVEDQVNQRRSPLPETHVDHSEATQVLT